MGITYELVFFHKVLQFNHMYAGLLVLIGQIADGFATVFVGIFSDKGKVLLSKSFYPSKGQLISERNYCVFESPKKPKPIF